MIGLGFILWGRVLAGPLIVDDEKLFDTFTQKLGAMADANQATEGKTLAMASKDAPTSVGVRLPDALQQAAGYTSQVKSVFVIGSVFKCSKCEHWHSAVSATAWCLTADGLMVTNHHVFEKAEGAAWGVCGVDGQVYRVLKIVATNAVDDVTVFQVDAKDLIPLPLGNAAEVGDKVSIISHPDHRCFFRTSGEVARYMKSPQSDPQPGSIRMSVTADFAQGSSGAPVFNAAGAVVGMVSATQSIYNGAAKPDAKEPPALQMVIKNCVPLAALRHITTAPVTAAAPE